MDNQHPITPPPELVEKWLSEHYGAVSVEPGTATSHVATQAARWGADQELEACCEWLDHNSPIIGAFHLRIDRRPKPPSLKELALTAVAELEGFKGVDIIRRAIKQLPDAL